MKLGRNIGSVTIPKRPSTVGGLIGWARGVNRTLQELRDRKVSFPNGRMPVAPSHPWKVRSNGDDTVSVAAGKILSWAQESAGLSTIPAYFHLREFADYAGGTVTGINADGYIYASIPWVDTGGTIFQADMSDGLQIERVVPDELSSVTVAFAAALPTTGDVFIVELARVTFADSVATVSDQVITHNPQMWSIDILPESEPPP